MASDSDIAPEQDSRRINTFSGIETVQGCAKQLTDALARFVEPRGVAETAPVAVLDVRASLADAAQALRSDYGPTDDSIEEETEAQLALADGACSTATREPDRADAPTRSLFVHELLKTG
jgi:hypothetical protein